MKVELIAYTPNPDDVCGVASRTCVSKTIPPRGDLFGDWSNSANALRNALASGHESVAEHANFTFAISGVSRALTHQLVRHRIASFSQQSQRYVNMDGFEYVMPESIEQFEEESQDDLIRFPEEELYDGFCMQHLYEAYHTLMGLTNKLYKKLVEVGIPEEDARYILPNACCTNIVVSVNARELRHIAGLRMCARAQWEVRELVTNMVKLAKEVAPTLFEGVGARCEQLGYCPEQRGCGKYQKGTNNVPIGRVKE